MSRCPDDFYDSEIAGKTLKYETTLNSIDLYETAEITDDWIFSITSYKTVDEWKAATKANLKAAREEEQEYDFGSQLMQLVKEDAVFDELPAELVSAMVQEYKDQDSEYAGDYNCTLEDFVKQYYKYNSFDAYEEDLKVYVEDSIKMDFLVAALKDAEGVSISDDEYASFLEKCVEEYDMSSESALVEEYGEEALREACLAEKVWDTVKEYNTMVVVEASVNARNDNGGN